MELPRFNHAAKCLADAAIAFSAAAQALTVAAQAFSSAGTELEGLRFCPVGCLHNIPASEEPVSHQQKPTVGPCNSTNKSRVISPIRVPAKESDAEERCSVVEDDYYLSGKFSYNFRRSTNSKRATFRKMKMKNT